MICPNCRQFTPDQNYRCIQCGAVTVKPPPAGEAERPAPLRRDPSSFFRPWMALLLGLLALVGFLAYRELNRSHAVNAHRPGLEFAIAGHLQKGKTTIVDFYSDYCPPCRQMAPLLVQLAKKRPDLAVIKVDINRKGVKGIDWGSPLARQYELQAIPYFRIYDPEGNLQHDGQEATLQVITMMARAGIDLK